MLRTSLRAGLWLKDKRVPESPRRHPTAHAVTRWLKMAA